MISPPPSLLRLSPTRAVWQVAWPVIALGQLRSACFLLGSFWAGRMGESAPSALSALGGAAFALWILGTLSELPAVGTHALVAFSEGGGKRHAAGRLTASGLWVAMLLSLALALFSQPLISLYFQAFGFDGPDFDAALAQGVPFLGALLLGAFFLMAHAVTDASFRGLGDTRTPLLISALALALNAVLDPLLMFGAGPLPALGLAGAGWATVSSHGVALFFSLRALGRRGLGPFPVRPDPSLLRRIFSIGFPQSVSGTGFCLVYVALGGVITRFGPEAVAGLGLGHRLESLAFQVCIGFGAGAATLVGQNLGRGEQGQASRAAHRAAFLSTLAMVPFALAFVSVPEVLMGAFSSDPATVRAGGLYLLCAGGAAVFMALEIVYEGAFAGAADTATALKITLPLTLLRIPLAWGLALHAGLGVMGIWLAIALTTVGKGLLLRLAFRKRWG